MGILDRIAGRFDELVSTDAEDEARAQEELARGRECAATGDLDGAAAAFGRATSLAPGLTSAWVALGEALSRLDRFEPARDAFRRALARDLSGDERARVQGALGRLYAKAGRTGNAIRELRKALAVRSDDVETLAALGRALLVDEEAEGAEWLARAARLSGTTGVGYFLEAARARGASISAESLLREARALAPDNALVRAALARHFASTGDNDRAFEEVQAATSLEPGNPDVWAAFREVQGRAGDFGAALEAARKETAAGGAVPFSEWLRLALGAEDLSAVEEALRHGDSRAPCFREAQAFVEGKLSNDTLGLLLRHAPSARARLFVARTAAPPAIPEGRGLELLLWAESFAIRHTRLAPLAVPLARAVEAFDRPLLVAVMGEFNAGKSSFVNALAGASVASVGVTPTTATINVLRYGPGGARVIFHDGRSRELASDDVSAFLHALDDDGAAAIRQVEIFAPVDSLRRVEIVDTPGLNSLRPSHEKVARDFLLEADALVWVFAAGQAAKATERDALAMAHGAGKHVIGVLNKVDRASPEEVASIVQHIQRQLGDLVERVIPFSARQVCQARSRGDGRAEAEAGLTAVVEALERDFFARARQLKTESAASALRRFIAEARAAVEAAPHVQRDFQGESAAISDVEQRLRAALAAERVALRARLDASFRAAAYEVRDFMRPRAWPFGEHSADPEDEHFLTDLLDDGVVAASGKTRDELVATVAPALVPSFLPVSELVAAIDEAIERFRAYGRGIVEGAAAVFFRVDLPRIRLETAAIHNALARWSPDPEEALFRPLQRAIDLFQTRARAALDDRRQTDEIAALMQRELLSSPLESLAAAAARLVHRD